MKRANIKAASVSICIYNLNPLHKEKKMSNLAVIRDSLEKDLILAGVQLVLPEHVKMSSFVRCAAIAISQGKGLAEANKESVIMALTKCATDGLVPDGKEAALVVYNTKVGDEWIQKAQYLPMIDGVLKRARMSGQIDSMAAKAVYENDEFDYWLDENGEHLSYRPTFGPRGKFKLAFAFAKLKTGDFVVEVMTKEDIDIVRASSKTGKFGPWVDWYPRMACKTVFHRIAKRLPNSSEILEMCEAGMNMNFEKDMGSVQSYQDQPAKIASNELKALAKKQAPQIAQSTPDQTNDIDIVKFMKVSIDVCTTIEDLEECWEDIKNKKNDGEFKADEFKIVKEHCEAALSSMRNQ